MPALKGQHRRSKSTKSNPYSDRGLDQFALVSAELQASREKLLARFGTSLSLVRFAIGSDQSKWIPIIVSQTSSQAELRALRRAASDLITGDRHAFDGFNAGNRIVGASGDHVGNDNTRDNTTHTEISEINTHAGSGINEISIESSTLASIDKNDVGLQAGMTKAYQDSYLTAAMQGLLWMVKVIAFGSRILADMASNAILWGARVNDVEVTSHPPPRRIAKEDTKRMKPPPSLRLEAPKRGKVSRFPSAPSTPPASQQLRKPLIASVSLPKTTHSRGLAPHTDIKENDPAQKTMPRSPTSMAKESVTEKERKEMSEKLGQALTGTGLVLVLSGLVIGYIPAVLGVVCWWYVLPNMRKAVGDKPFVRSHHIHHHHSSQEDRNMSTSNNKDRGRHGSAKEDTHSQEYTKKVIMDGLLDRRRRHHSQA